MRDGPMRRKSNGLLQKSVSLSLSLKNKRAAKIGEDSGMVGRQGQCPTMHGDGLIQLTQFTEQRSQEEMRFHQSRGEFLGETIAGQGSLALANAAPHGAKVDEGRNTAGIKAQRIQQPW